MYHSENNFNAPLNVWMQGNFYGSEHSAVNCFYFSLNVLKFELQYEWTPIQIFYGGYCVFELLYHNVEHCTKNVPIRSHLLTESLMENFTFSAV